MRDQRIDQYNAEIAELETWLREHPNHLPEDKVAVRMQIYRKTILRDALISEQLSELANKENQI